MRLRIIFIGHNATEFLRQQQKYRESMASPGTAVEITSIAEGPETIEGDLDEIHAAPAILKEVIRAQREGADAVIVDCALDPCLSALREAVRIPVIGAGQAAFAIAACLGERFSIICPLPSLIPAYHRRIRQYGLTAQLASIRSIDVPILDLLGAEAKRAFVAAGRNAMEKDGADTLVLGCTGMSPAVPGMREKLGVPLVDPAGAAIAFAEMLVKLGLSQSVVSFPKPGGSVRTAGQRANRRRK